MVWMTLICLILLVNSTVDPFEDFIEYFQDFGNWAMDSSYTLFPISGLREEHLDDGAEDDLKEYEEISTPGESALLITVKRNQANPENHNSTMDSSEDYI